MIQNTIPLVHGGDWAGFEMEYGTPPMDFSSNVSPLGLPESVRRAAAEALWDAERYPDPLCRELRRAIAGAEGVSENWCLCGCGSADLIYRVVLAVRPRRALVTAPAFAEYEAALELVQCDTAHYPLKEETDFALDGGVLNAVTPDTDMVFLCQPNNPTGRSVSRSLLVNLLDRCREVRALLVVDECFCDFLDDPGTYTMKELLGRYENLLILKAFTKLYAMAGLRLGYCLCACAPLVDAMRVAGQPWAVSGPAQAAGLAALRETEYVQTVCALISLERPWLRGELTRLGFRVIPGEANYLLFFSPKPLAESLRRRGILLRDCGNYRGLGSGWYRTAVRTHEENCRLAAALADIMKEGEK